MPTRTEDLAASIQAGGSAGVGEQAGAGVPRGNEAWRNLEGVVPLRQDAHARLLRPDATV